MMRRPAIVLRTAVVLAASSFVVSLAEANNSTTPKSNGELGELDRLHALRDDPAAFAQLRARLDAALARRPGDYALLWRAARAAFWEGDDPAVPADKRSSFGKKGWDLAERAIAANPNDVAGHYWSAANIGNYSLGIGVLTALTRGIEGKFRTRLSRATELQRSYESGGIDVAWGRFYFELPWPKRDLKKSEEHLRYALRAQPHQLAARVCLAELLLKKERPTEAKTLLNEVVSAPVGRYDAPEERRTKVLAAALVPRVDQALK